jgi:hypothetical protein
MLYARIVLANDHIIKSIQTRLGRLEEIPSCYKLVNPNLLPGTRHVFLETQTLRALELPDASRFSAKQRRGAACAAL